MVGPPRGRGVVTTRLGQQPMSGARVGDGEVRPQEVGPKAVTEPNKFGAASQSRGVRRTMECVAGVTQTLVAKRLRGKQPPPTAAAAVGDSPAAGSECRGGEAVSAGWRVMGNAECADSSSSVRPRVVKRPAAEGSSRAGRGQEPRGRDAKVHRSRAYWDHLEPLRDALGDLTPELTD